MNAESLHKIFNNTRISSYLRNPLIKKGNNFEEINWDTALDLVAKELLEKETLEGEEFEKLVGPKKGEREERIEAAKQEVAPAPTSA